MCVMVNRLKGLFFMVNYPFSFAILCLVELTHVIKCFLGSVGQLATLIVDDLAKLKELLQFKQAELAITLK